MAKKRTEKKARKRAARQALLAAASRPLPPWKRVPMKAWTVFTAVVLVLGIPSALDAWWPTVAVEMGSPLSGEQPFSVPFHVSSKGGVFPAQHTEATCHIRSALLPGGLSLTNFFVGQAASAEALQDDAFDGTCKIDAGRPVSADLGIIVTYTVAGFSKSDYRRFAGRPAQGGGWRWLSLPRPADADEQIRRARRLAAELRGG